MRAIEIEKTELVLIQFSMIVWTIIFLTVTISNTFPEIIDITSKDIVGLQMIDEIVFSAIHMILIIAILMSVPMIYLVDKFYRKYLMKFINVKQRNGNGQ